MANYNPTLKEDIKITNSAKMWENGGKTIETETKNQIMEATVKATSSNTSTENNKTQETEKQEISGTAWIDNNSNGVKDNYENTIENMPVKLLNAKTNEFVKDEQGNDKIAYTDTTGKYTFTDVE